MNSNRLFFALWPSEEIRRSIVDAQSRLYPPVDGRVIPPENYHITLHFIGSVTDDIRQCMHESAQSVSAESFSLTLNRFAYFDKAKVFWIGPDALAPALIQLHEKLGEALTSCEFRSETRSYSPHVSLIRKVKSNPLENPDFFINWQVDDFVMVESISTENGVNYTVIKRYPLSA